MSADTAFVSLDVGGRIYRTALSTLTSPPNDGSYLARRLSGSIPPGASYQDELGRTVYLIDRDGDIFKYVLAYLRTNRLPLGKFSENPQLWRDLREEAEFYALDGLCNLLKVTHVRDPAECGDRGVLYWLGTRRGTSEYRNPYAIDAVGVGGWIDSIDKAGLKALDGSDVDVYSRAGSQEDRQVFVQYQPAVGSIELDSSPECHLLFCDHSRERKPVVVDLLAISVRPTHYSIRTEACGMDTWNFEASVDGEMWDALHRARGDTNLPPSCLMNRREKRRLFEFLEGIETNEDGAPIGSAALSAARGYVERYRRHTWEISTVTFYRYFRFIGVGPDAEEEHGNSCMHGVGFEIFGDIHEM